jgi:arsenate reductase
MLFDQIINTIEGLNSNTVTEDRKTVLNDLIEYIQDKKNLDEVCHINFVCTHNSRRSHLAQIWAQTCAGFFNVSKVVCYSGGTEATKLYRTVKDTLEDQGFIFKTAKEESNKKYEVFFSNIEKPINTFSKVYDHKVNPVTNFAVIMTCSHADENCPFIPGAEKRISVMYEDPKLYDNSILEKKMYRERSIQIATEMKYIFSNIK